MKKLENRVVALQEGKKFYFTGKPCKYGHIAQRVVRNHQCHECRKLEDRLRKAANYHVDIFKSRKEARQRYLVDPNRKEILKRSRIKNRSTVNKNKREWGKRNRDFTRAANAYHRALKMQRTPIWANKQQIRNIYKQAKNLGMVVDHIIPLRGRTVSGLHVETNLQLLTKEENLRKTNNYVD